MQDSFAATGGSIRPSQYLPHPHERPFAHGMLDSHRPGAESANRYAYVGNSPLSFTDPTGLSSRATRLPKHDAGTHGSLIEGTIVIGSGENRETTVAGLDEVTVTASRLLSGRSVLSRFYGFGLAGATGGNGEYFGQARGGVGGGEDGAAQSEPDRTGGEGQGEVPSGTCRNAAASTHGQYASQFVDDTVLTILGIADAFTFGGYTTMTESLGLGAIEHNVAYNAGLYGAAGMSAGRLLYAGSAAVIRYVPGISAAGAVTTRNSLKGVFSTMGADHPRAYSLSAMMSKYGSETEVINAASRTNAYANTAAAELGYSSASQIAGSGCP